MQRLILKTVKKISKTFPQLLILPGQFSRTVLISRTLQDTLLVSAFGLQIFAI